MTHANAPSPRKAAMRLIGRCKTRPIAHVAAEMGISRACASEELLYSRTWTSEQQLSDAVAVWKVHYNYPRPHGAAGGKPPAAPVDRRAHQRHGLIQLGIARSRMAAPPASPSP